MRKRKPPDELRGAQEFAAFYSSLSEDSELHNMIKASLDALREDMFAGEKIEKKKWPKKYVQEYGIHNLFKMDVGRECRLTYTIIAEGEKKIVCVIEFFSSHKSYDRRFGYS